MPLGTTAAHAPPKAAGGGKAKATKAASNRDEFDLRGECPGVIKLLGVIDALTTGTLLLKYKRHGSTKYEIKPIALDKIVMIRGEAKVGGIIEVTFQSERAIFTRIRKVSLSGFDEKLRMTRGTDENDRPIYIRPDCCNAVTMSEVVAPPVAPPQKY